MIEKASETDSRKGKTTVRMGDEIHLRAKLAATNLRIPVQRFVEQAVAEKLARMEALRPKAVASAKSKQA